MRARIQYAGILVWGVGLWACAASPSRAAPIVVVKAPGQGMDSSVKAVEWALQAFLVAFDAMEVSPANPLKDLPADCRVAVLTQPFASRLSKAEMMAIERFVARGGKVLAAGQMPPELAELLGFQIGFLNRMTSAHEFHEIALDTKSLPGCPESIVQASRESFVVMPFDSTKVVGHWRSERQPRFPRRNMEIGALLLSPAGAYFTSDLTREQIRRKGQLLHALIAHFIPTLWETTSKAWIDKAGRIGRFASLDDYKTAIETAQGKERFVKLSSEWDRALRMKQEAGTAFAAKDYPRATNLAVEATETLERLYPQAFPSPASEFRGLWISDFPYGSNGTPVANWEELCHGLKQAEFTAIFPFIGAAGLAHYNSRLIPTSAEVSSDTDRLKQCLEAAHKEGLQVHAWHSVLVVGDEKEVVSKRMANEGRVVIDAKGQPVKFLCPTQPANWEYEIELCREITTHYPVDGLHLDYMRFPTYPPTYCYCAACKQRFQTDTGGKISNWPGDVLSGDMAQKYLSWGTAQITNGLARWSEAMRKAAPKVKLSAAVFGWPDARAHVGQDSKTWIDKGLLDFLVYMNFHPNNSYYASLVASQVAEAAGRLPVYSGIGAYSHACWFASPVELIEQVQLAREQGAKGYVIYQNTPTFAGDFLRVLMMSR